VLVAVLGGGQLGRMLALAGIPLGLRFRFLDPTPGSPAGQVAEQIVGAYDDREALLRLADGADLVTFEFENVPADSARFLAERVPVLPPPAALEAGQDRLTEKTLFGAVGLPVPELRPVDDLDSLLAGLEAVGLPAALKTRRLGYDGKGQAVIRDRILAEDAWRTVDEAPSIVEARVAFDREVSILGVRSRDGETMFWPVIENHHRDGILRRSIAPAPGITPAVQAAAEAHARALMAHLHHVGVLAIELFQRGDELLANEMAPRVHNSGHWTIEGSETSQFENHLRAVCGLPLGTTSMRGVAGMVNVIGRSMPSASLLRIPGAHVHDYGKEPRPGRKVGHVTVRADDLDQLAARVEAARSLVE
jgi:5-(carboxyamino)imidazole ribonucleotide synthase